MDKVLRGLAACICRCARRSRAVALVPDRAWSAAGARVRGGRCQRLVLVVPPQKLFSVEHGVVPRAPTDALQLWRVRGCVRRAYFDTEIYESLLFDYCRK